MIELLAEKMKEIYRDHNDIGTERVFKNREIVRELKEANSGKGDIVTLKVSEKDIFVPQLFLGSTVSKDMVRYPEYLIYVFEEQVYEPILAEDSIDLEDYMTTLRVINGSEIIEGGN